MTIDIPQWIEKLLLFGKDKREFDVGNLIEIIFQALFGFYFLLGWLPDVAHVLGLEAEVSEQYVKMANVLAGLVTAISFLGGVYGAWLFIRIKFSGMTFSVYRERYDLKKEEK